MELLVTRSQISVDTSCNICNGRQMPNHRVLLSSLFVRLVQMWKYSNRLADMKQRPLHKWSSSRKDTRNQSYTTDINPLGLHYIEANTSTWNNYQLQHSKLNHDDQMTNQHRTSHQRAWKWERRSLLWNKQRSPDNPDDPFPQSTIISVRRSGATDFLQSFTSMP